MEYLIDTSNHSMNLTLLKNKIQERNKFIHLVQSRHHRHRGQLRGQEVSYK